MAVCTQGRRSGLFTAPVTESGLMGSYLLSVTPPQPSSSRRCVVQSNYILVVTTSQPVVSHFRREEERSYVQFSKFDIKCLNAVSSSLKVGSLVCKWSANNTHLEGAAHKGCHPSPNIVNKHKCQYVDRDQN